MEEKKKNLLAVLHILREYSDEEHILTQKMISNKLNELYDLDLDRRTIYKNMEILEEFGYDISDYSDNGVGYYLGDREFDKNEVFLLCNAIHSSNFIPPHNSKELIQKLLSTQSKYKREEYERVNFVDNNNKKDNKEFFLNIELLSEAITNRQVISFDYMRYNKDKELIKRREEPYYVCPYYLVYIGENQQVKLSYIKSKKLLDYYKKLCLGKKEVLHDLVKDFNRETNDGKDMEKYSSLLVETIENILGKKQEAGVKSLFSKGGTATVKQDINGLEEFELVTFLIIK